MSSCCPSFFSGAGNPGAVNLRSGAALHSVYRNHRESARLHSNAISANYRSNATLGRFLSNGFGRSQARIWKVSGPCRGHAGAASALATTDSIWSGSSCSDRGSIVTRGSSDNGRAPKDAPTETSAPQQSTVRTMEVQPQSTAMNILGPVSMSGGGLSDHGGAAALIIKAIQPCMAFERLTSLSMAVKPTRIVMQTLQTTQ
jgi:hypothetical protein